MGQIKAFSTMNQNSEELVLIKTNKPNLVKELIKVLQTNTDLKIEILNIPSENIITTTNTDLKHLLNKLIEKNEKDNLEENLEQDYSDIQEKDIDKRDIDLVANQAGVSRAKALEALQKQNGNVVNAIMDLTLV